MEFDSMNFEAEYNLQAERDKLNAQLISNDSDSNVLNYLREELSYCTNFTFSVAFVTPEGLNLLQMKLKELEEKGYRGKLLTSSYLKFNNPRAFRDLMKIKNVEVHVTEKDFHTKGYLFEHKDRYTSLIGSSNLTKKALMNNIEWNLSLNMWQEEKIYKNINKAFSVEWEESIPLTEEWIKRYEIAYERIQKIRNEEENEYEELAYKKIKMNEMQTNAVSNLVEMRKNGVDKALIISATGTGKTYLAAFDVEKVKPKRLLFLAHQERLLKNARESFTKILGNGINTGLFYAKTHEIEADFLFASVYSLQKDKYLDTFKRNHFDYIIVDEVHHVGAEIYNKILNHFKPQFLLGMTATPERNDDYNVFDFFDYNIAYEIRLQDALAQNMLCPFHYFGISDITIEGKVIEKDSDFNLLVDDQRIKHIIENADYYGYSGDRVRGLIFCSNVKEAKMISSKLNESGLKTVALTGSETTGDQRESAIKRLENKQSSESLDYIITVDIFNEGIDIPSVNQIIMLRRTESSIIFIQQLGRGLRKDKSKEYVTILDFIGNYDRNFYIPVALSGDSSFDKDKLRKFMHNTNLKVPGASSIEFDHIVKERIYAAIDVANFKELKFIKEQYLLLKRKLGRIPKHIDFLNYEAIDLQIIMNIKYCKSYLSFLKRYDDEFVLCLDDGVGNLFDYISSVLANGKRPHELMILKLLIERKKITEAEITKQLLMSYNLNNQDVAIQSSLNVLAGNFLLPSEMARFDNICLIQKTSKYIKLHEEIDKILENHIYREWINDLIEYGLMNYLNKYRDGIDELNFSLYETYSRKDICRLLNWEKNEVATNIGGYRYNHKNNNMCVFITYNKDKEGEATNYEDRFIDRNHIICISKKKRSIGSKDMMVIKEAQEKGTNILLFMKRSKIEEAFYYLGEVEYADNMLETTIIDQGKENKVVEIYYRMKEPVREDIYKYMINYKKTEIS